MLKKMKNIILAALLPLTLAAPVAVAVPAFAATPVNTNCSSISDSIKEGLGSTNGTAACGDSTTGNGTDLPGLAKKIVNLLSIVVGVVAVIMIIYGGFRYITSGGESSNVSGAKNTLIYAIVGLVIVALSQFIVHFVLQSIGS